ncbi:hypothetical protein JW796_01185 [Candidatus Dojkabacteria bacterium]|nr:hypothetical protein [Candidatus Dojkabacteria bacterium]
MGNGFDNFLFYDDLAVLEIFEIKCSGVHVVNDPDESKVPDRPDIHENYKPEKMGIFTAADDNTKMFVGITWRYVGDPEIDFDAKKTAEQFAIDRYHLCKNCLMNILGQCLGQKVSVHIVGGILSIRYTARVIVLDNN